MTVRSPKNPKATKDESEPKRAPAFRPPLKPRPLLFALLWIVLLAWLGTLLWMRFRTIKEPAARPTPVRQFLSQ